MAGFKPNQVKMLAYCECTATPTIQSFTPQIQFTSLNNSRDNTQQNEIAENFNNSELESQTFPSLLKHSFDKTFPAQMTKSFAFGPTFKEPNVW